VRSFAAVAFVGMRLRKMLLNPRLKRKISSLAVVDIDIDIDIDIEEDEDEEMMKRLGDDGGDVREEAVEEESNRQSSLPTVGRVDSSSEEPDAEVVEPLRTRTLPALLRRARPLILMTAASRRLVREAFLILVFLMLSFLPSFVLSFFRSFSS